MDEQNNQPLTRAQQALAAASEARHLLTETRRNSADQERIRSIVERSLWDLIAQPGITFIASMGNESEIGPNLPAVTDLAYRLRYGMDVENGQLAQVPYRAGGLQVSERDATELVQGVITRLNENSIEYFLAWHITGSTELHLDYARMTNRDAFRGLTSLLIDEVGMTLA